MKKILLLFCVALIVQSCVLSQNDSLVELVYAPKLDVVFDQDQNFKSFKTGRLLLYDPADMLFRDTLVLEEGLDKQIGVVHGVKSGVYTLVTMCNSDGMIVDGLELASDNIDKLRVKTEYFDGPKLFMLHEKFELKRGDPQLGISTKLPMFYNLTIRLTNLNELTQPPIGPYLEMVGISNVFNYRGEAMPEGVATLRMPDLITKPNGDLEISCMCAKFSDDNNVKIIVKELVKETIETVVIKPSGIINPDKLTPQDLIIEMRYKAHSFELIINDWIMGEYSFAEFGG